MSFNDGFDPDIAGGNLLVIGVVQGQGLIEREQVLVAVAAGERLRDRLGSWRGTGSRAGGQRLGVAFAGKDRADDAHAGRAGDVGDDVVELQIHLSQRLLHVLDVEAGVFQQTARADADRPAAAAICPLGRKLARSRP